MPLSEPNSSEDDGDEQSGGGSSSKPTINTTTNTTTAATTASTTKDKAGSHLCELCDKSYESAVGLYYHRRSKHLGVVYECEFRGCNKVFAQASGCRRHMRTQHHMLPSKRVGRPKRGEGARNVRYVEPPDAASLSPAAAAILSRERDKVTATPFFFFFFFFFFSVVSFRKRGFFFLFFFFFFIFFLAPSCRPWRSSRIPRFALFVPFVFLTFLSFSLSVC
jgi:hypothetical protein